MTSSPTNEIGILVILPLFVVSFVPLWIGAVFLTSLFSGWGALASHYATDRHPPAHVWTFQSGSMRLAGYNHILTVGANREGFYLSTMILFRFGHRPLFVPWSDITVTPKTNFFRSGMEFRLGRHNPVPLWLSAHLSEQVRQASL